MSSPEADTPAHAPIWRAVAVFCVVTALASGVLWWVQSHFDIAWWVVNLTSLAPAVGTAAVLALRRPARLAATFHPGWGLDGQVIRRTLVFLGLGIGVVLGCTQFGTLMRWPVEAVALADVPYPFALPGDRSTTILMLALTYFLMAGFEELGWRSLLQPTLLQRHGVVITGLVVGVAWAVLQPLTLVRMESRWAQRHSLLEMVLYAGAAVVAAVATSWVLVLAQQQMRRGQWISAVAFRTVVQLGLFLILEEELGRWQPMGAIALVSLAFATVGLFYHWRGLRAGRTPQAGPTHPAT